VEEEEEGAMGIMVVDKTTTARTMVRTTMARTTMVRVMETIITVDIVRDIIRITGIITMAGGNKDVFIKITMRLVFKTILGSSITSVN
jgi:hypothetical protein